MAKRLPTLDLFAQAIRTKPVVARKLATVAKAQIEITAPDSQAVMLWDKCLEIIKDNVAGQVFKTWFEPITALCWKDSQLTIQVPSQFFYEWIEEHYYALLQKTIYQVLGSKSKLQYQVLVNKSGDTLEQRAIKLPAFRNAPATGTQSNQQNILPFASTTPVHQKYPNYLNSRYTFENFIRGESNQLASSGAMTVSEAPGKTRFNPLFIYGGTGLGKTHLVQAIGNHIVQNNSSTRVLYTNSERFTIEYVNAIQNNKVNEFTNFYRTIDVLIVDDIQFFSGKEKTQDNFFHTFNALYQAGKQLILTSDKPPKELTDVDDRLISRFQWGLTVDVQLPDYETRMAILQRKSLDEGFEIPSDIIEFIARHVFTSVRELEGSLISLIAKVSLDRRELSLDLAKEVVRGVSAPSDKSITIQDIIREVTKFYNFPLEDLAGKSRKHEIVLARQVAMYLTKRYTPLSLKNIGTYFGGRDHTTVLHSCQMITNYLGNDKSVVAAIESLTRIIGRD
ncbi:MAG: chromosomal replication initiator protein DnaA [Ignavibacteriae bacterium]|nr:chromosomal replication initiator protein DnaA [Ignavibacteriota bacterium]